MHEIETNIFAVYKFHYCFRYVDDIIVLVPADFNIFCLLSIVNLIERYIQFSLEVENYNHFLFLGVMVSKHKDQFSTSVFRKYLPVSLFPYDLFSYPPHMIIVSNFLKLRLSFLLFPLLT